MSKYRWLNVVFVFAAVLLTGACGQSQAKPLRIVVLPITDTVPFYVAQEQGYYDKQGLKVKLIPAASAAERDQLLTSGQADGEVSDLVATALFNASEPRLKVVRTARQASAGAPQFRLLAPANSQVHSAADLRGKEIAVSQNSIIQYITERLLEKSGVAASDVKLVSVPQIAVRLQLLQESKVAAATLPDPLSSLALLQGAQPILDDSADPEISQSVITFRAEVIKQRPQDIKRFLAAYEQALADIRTNPDSFHNLLIEKGRVPEALRDQYTFPPFPDAVVPSEAAWQDVMQWCLDKGLISKAIAYKDVVDASFLPK